MKKLLLVVCASILWAGAMPASAANTKRVCQNKTVNGKVTKVCKDIKIHKKLSGTKVPVKK